MARIASVVLTEGLKSFDKLYDYRVPEPISQALRGMRVLVPFGRADKLQAAWVIHQRDEEVSAKLKEIRETVDDEPLLNDEMIKLAEWMKNRYFCTWGEAISAMLPAGVNLSRQTLIQYVKEPEYLKPGMEAALQRLKQHSQGMPETDFRKLLPDEEAEELKRQGVIVFCHSLRQRVSEKTQKAVVPTLDPEEFQEMLESGSIKSIYQIRAMELILQEGLCTLQDLLLIPGVSHATIRTLAKKGWVAYTEVEQDRDPFLDMTEESTVPPVLTEEQSRVYAALLPHLSGRSLHEVLLHGITGSGKTEIYLRLIDSVIRSGRTAIVLVPEISLTPQMTSRFTGRFGKRVAILHSRLSLGERYDQWRKIRQGDADVVIGARSAVFAPLANIGIIIVDEEHEWTYKSDNTPKYDARHIARARCNMHGAMLLQGSATPSVETYYRAKAGKIILGEMSARANARALPQVLTVDMRKELEEGNRSLISKSLEEELILNREAGEQSILFLNRRGYATFLLCADCGFVLKCPHCSVSLTYHVKENQSICHYCGFALYAAKVCPSCKGNHFKSFGTGTQKIEEELLRHPAGFKVLRMDLDTTGTKHGHRNVLEAFRKGEADILVGTQMVAKGHDFPNVTLVGILAADASLFTGDHRASERTFQLITQASGRAGRGDKPGRVILQTYNTEDYAITTAVNQDYENFYRQEIMIREQLNNPPFTHLAQITVSSRDASVSESTALRVHALVEESFGKESYLHISGSMKAPLFILRSKVRYRIIIKHASVNRLLHILKTVQEAFARLRTGEAQVSVDIDPASMI